MRLGIGSIYLGEKVSFRKFKKAKGLICHTMLDARAIKNGQFDKELH